MNNRGVVGFRGVEDRVRGTLTKHLLKNILFSFIEIFLKFSKR